MSKRIQMITTLSTMREVFMGGEVYTIEEVEAEQILRAGIGIEIVTKTPAPEQQPIKTKRQKRVTV